MTIDKMIEWFDLIQDKSESVYFSNENKLEFINRAQDLFINKVLFSFLQGQKKVQESPMIGSGIESTSSSLEKIWPLVLEDLIVSSDASGFISFDTIEGAINSATGGGFTVLHTLNISKDGNYIRFVRHNDFYRHNKNSFKTPTATYPTFRISRNGLTINPTGVGSYKVSVVKSPLLMEFNSFGDPLNVSSELPETTHNEIMSIALGFAGLSSRDEALIQTQTLRNES
jgi:hypothetical protein